MPKINLLKSEEEKHSDSSNLFINWILSYGRVIIICTELVVFIVFFSRFVYDVRLEELQDTIEQKQNIVKSASQFEQTFLTTQKKLELVRMLETDRYKLVLALDMLETITPKLVRYTKISMDNAQVSLDGSASDNESLAVLLAQLKTQNEFDTISLKSLKQLEDEDTLEFSLVLTFKKELDDQQEQQTQTNSQEDLL
jgi:Tfp pilus assembly protein PilN